MVRVNGDNANTLSFLPPGFSNPWPPMMPSDNVSISLPADGSIPCPDFSTSDLKFNFSTDILCAILTEHRNQQVLDHQAQAIVIAAYASLIAIGIVSNVLVCCVVVRQTSHKTAHLGGKSRNLYILNLALADLALCCICMPLNLHNLLYFHWTMGVLLCKLAPVIQATNMLVSAGTITAIALDRYNTIVRSSRKRKDLYGGGLSVAAGVAIIWLLSLLLTSPLFFYTQLESVSFHGIFLYDKCVEHWPSDTFKIAFSIAITGVQFVIPVLILSAIHIKISSYLKLHLRPFQRPKIEIHSPIDPRNEHNIRIPLDDDLQDEKRPFPKEYLNIKRKESICSDNSQRSDSSRKYSDCSESKRLSTPDISPRKRSDFLSSFRENSEFSFSFSKLSRDGSKKSPKRVRKELRRNRRTTLLLSCIASVYAISWLPYNIYNIAINSGLLNAEPPILYTIFAATHLTAMTSVCVNPFLYGWLNTNFRCEFHNIFGSFFSCFSKLFKKCNKIVNSNKFTETAMIHREFEGRLPKKTVLSFIPSHKADAVVVAIYSDATQQPPL